MGDLVGEHRRHLRLVPGEREHAAGDEHALAGQREGVRVGLVGDDEAPAAAGAGGGDQPPADAGDVGRQAGVGIDRARPHDGPRHDRGRLRRGGGGGGEDRRQQQGEPPHRVRRLLARLTPARPAG